MRKDNAAWKILRNYKERGVWLTRVSRRAPTKVPEKDVSGKDARV